MNEYQHTLKLACQRDRKTNEKTLAQNSLTHEILKSEDAPDIKVMRLHTECGFGMMRAEELVYGSSRPKRPYQNQEVDKDIWRFYKI